MSFEQLPARSTGCRWNGTAWCENEECGSSWSVTVSQSLGHTDIVAGPDRCPDCGSPPKEIT